MFSRSKLPAPFLLILIILLCIISSQVSSQPTEPSPDKTIEQKPSLMNGLPPEKTPTGPSQAELREKFKNQIGGFAFGSSEKYYSLQVARMLDSQWAIGLNGYSNTYVNRFDNDAAYSYYLPPHDFYGRLRNHQEKYWGGAFFVQRFIADSPFFVSLWLGREHYQKNQTALYWESAGNTYRFEKDSYSSGPRNYAGFGVGFRFQAGSGLFFGWEGVWSWYAPYSNSFSVSDLYYSDRTASIGDLLYRRYAYQNSERLPGTSFGLNLFVGWAF
ncbi:hypothetical protein V6Z05_05330 [Leptospira venezuelensis]|uniref:hypothetical protein n=1 Tax=Leptospira venezuelensis TaxID=1958811 RepID=UPI000A3989D8|nr:hypothetical protein [Leptospira venezuelensis]